jgi:hypothetical protein
LITLTILLIILLLFLYMIKSPLFFNSGAATLTTSTTTEVTPALSLGNSYVFASPLRAKAGGEKIRITVFVLSDKGLGLPGKKVAIGSGSVLQVTPVLPVTDNQGRAMFDVSSGSTGVFVIGATADGTKLVQETSISFD